MRRFHTEILSNYMQNMPALMRMPIPSLAVLDTPLPALSVLDTPLNFEAARTAFARTVFQIPKAVQPLLENLDPSKRRVERVRKTRLSVPTRFTLTGEITKGASTRFAVDGQDFLIDDSTWILGILELGKQAQVRGVVASDGSWRASKITL